MLWADTLWDNTVVYHYVYGSGWSAMATGAFKGFESFGIDAWGDRICYYRSDGEQDDECVVYDGTSWNQTAEYASSGGIQVQPSAISPLDAYYYYSAYNAPQVQSQWAISSVGGVASLITWPGGVRPVPGRKDQLWFYPTTAAHVRMVRTGNWGSLRATQLGITDDHFTDADVYDLNTGSKDVYNVSSILYRTRDLEPGWAIFGSTGYSTLNENTTLTATPHCILVADIFASAERLYGKGGPMPATAPYTNSIPRTSGGPVWNGILICD